MSLNAALNLSVLELLQALNKKLGLECTGAREVRLPPGQASATTLEAEASTPWPIECLEARVHEVLKLIPSLRNLLQPVNRLPSEILSHVARCFLHEKTIDTRSIIPLTHVCRYWRESIISAPENWALISSERINLTELSLERCKAAPLKVYLNMDQVEANPRFSDLIGPYIKNTETLHLNRISNIEGLTRTLPNLSQSMPNLRSLSLSGLADWDGSINPFGPFTPTLTHLSLIRIPLHSSFMDLRTLTDLTLRNNAFNLHCDTLLDFLEENCSLKRATLEIRFTHPSFRISRRQLAIENRLQSLSICSINAMDNKALISRIALQRGAHLEITLYARNTESDDVLSIISTTHLSNLKSPTFMEYHPGSRIPFTEFPPPVLTNIREFRFIHRAWGLEESSLNLTVFPPSSFPALETLAIERGIGVSRLFSALFSNPSSSPLLKTLAFLDCDLDEGFMGGLTRFSSNRRNTTSAWLHRVVIANSKGNLPSVTSINALENHVPVVDVRIAKQLPTDLT
ncbi:hypothetical protein BDM02DRAFT_3186215 [Thelephora ganbajun]|uniref:Uncharacterized protein n=1 Tax=Thelephora ganbajun TaxID=370292 RepID=A0ACB6ZJN0_THEGA|nr:hypothetical protein BDM02DRAFT_3186215 [Thelephora ganbajun]